MQQVQITPAIKENNFKGSVQWRSLSLYTRFHAKKDIALNAIPYQQPRQSNAVVEHNLHILGSNRDSESTVGRGCEVGIYGGIVACMKGN